MHEEFDDRLKSRIADVFDNYEEASAEEGWMLLREKYPEKKERRPAVWLWWGSAAAVLLLALGLGIWFNGTNHQKNTITKITPGNNNDHHDTITHNFTAHTGEHNRDLDADRDQTTRVKPTDPQQVQPPHTTAVGHAKNVNDPATSRYMAKNNTAAHRDKPIKQVPTAGKTTLIPTAKITDPATQVMANNTDHHTEAHTATPDSGQLMANNTRPNEAIKPVVKQPEHPVFTAKSPNDIKVTKPVDPKVKFGVYAATYFNYAKGSDNQFNVGAGLQADIKLAGNLKLSTGVAIGQNALNYRSELPQKAGKYLTATLAAEQATNYSASVAPPKSAANSGFSSLTAPVTSPVLQNYQASLFALDIPVNLKYQFPKTDTYISAGVSSGTYISETYNYTYNYSNSLVKTNDQGAKSQNSFNTFDIARTLNVSFGMGYPLGKNNRLVVEPFLKYPLAGSGSQDLKFGAGGVNLKLNFSAGKK